MDTTSTSNPPIVHDPRVYLALPAYGGKIDSPFGLCLLQLAQAPNLIAQVEFLNGDSLVSRARNKLAHFFLNGREGVGPNGERALVMYEWLMFIDTDLIFQPADVARLYEYAKAKGPGIYCGAYPLKTLKPKVVFNPMPGAAIDADGVVKVREAGTGFMLIHRNVFEQMIERFRDEIEYESDSGNLGRDRQIEHDFFTVGVRRDPLLGFKRYLSEDWYFCQRWREIGGSIHLHTQIQCGHIGSFTFPAKPKEIKEAAEMFRLAEEQAAAKAKEAAA